MKVLFDSQIFDWQINGGISRYFIEVLQRLEKKKEIEPLLKVRHSYNTYIQDTRWLANRPVFKNLHFKGKLRALKSINQKINRPLSNRLLEKGVPDIFHPTYYDPYFLKHLKKKPFVLTVYDLTNEKFNDNSSYTANILRWKKELIGAANHIISISENTKKDIIEHYNTDPEKITTIYLSGGFDLSKKQDAKTPDLPPRFILFVGSRSGYKNFKSFLKESAPAIKKNDLAIIAAGGGNMDAEETELIKSLGIGDRVTAFSHVSDALLMQLYQKALIFIFPSLYEGFGIPVLEAMQCGCPALLSDNSSLPEVGGAAAAYFDPLREGALHDVLQSLIQDEDQRKTMAMAGYEQVKKFNWNNTAEGHLQVYQKMLA